MYDIDSILQAHDIQEAINALAADEGAVLISGGSDVLIKIREGKLAGSRLVSIHDISALKGVSMQGDGTLVIGAATSFAHITQNPLIQKHIPALGAAVDQVGGPQIRNIGTIGGNVCNGVTSADSASTLFVLNAKLHLVGKNGERTVPIAEFYAGPGRTVRAHDEILTEICIDKADYAGFGAHYIKYAQRNAMDIATLGCAVNVRLSADKRIIEDVRLAFGVAGPVPMRCPKAEAAINGRPVCEESIAAIGDIAVTEVSPRTSWRASKEFRLQLVRELSCRVLRRAIENAGGCV
ncbi:MAG: xanthine dehydrogenase FAD-binding subunit XdhB [Oscillospiraceae bacterium]|nr:xanthine dehydrogenase FAD-binding subunit XdhB [Oscillospiraceae bacterium]